MESKKLISIIVPVYNGEKHIGKCIEGLLKQTYRDFEIILVNDGSKDRTEKIINAWSEKDNRIKPINQINEGVSAARNAGIAVATGAYILFVDSDDSLSYNAIEKLVNKANSVNSDLVLFGFHVTGSKNRLNDTYKLLEISKVHEELKNKVIQSIISTNDNIFGYIWRAMYSREMLIENGILFPKGIKISEDYMFLLNAVNCSKRICIDTREYYNYIINESSMSIKYIPTLLHDMMYVNEWMYKTIVKDNETLQEGYYCSVCNTYLRYVQNTMRNSDKSFSEKVSDIKKNKIKYKFQTSINKVWYKYKNFNLKSELGMILFRFHCDFVYAILFEIKRINKERCK